MHCLLLNDLLLVSRKLYVIVLHKHTICARACVFVTTALYCWLKMLLCLCVLLIMVVSGQTAAQ